MDDTALVHCMHRARLCGLNSLLVIPSIQLDTLPLLNEDHWNELGRIRREDDTIASVEIKMPPGNCRPHKCGDIWLVDPDLVVDFADGEPRSRPRSTILRNSSLFSFPTLSEPPCDVGMESRFAKWEAEWRIRRDYLRGLAETKRLLYESDEQARQDRRIRHQQRLEDYHRALMQTIDGNQAFTCC
ncbi:hypothetical protein FOZ62_013711, partial [Perkinsus olseni]